MKQKIIYIVLLIVCMYFPATSRECGKVLQSVVPANALAMIKKPMASAEPDSNLPVSLFSKLLLKL